MSKSTIKQAIENIREKSKGRIASMTHPVTINFHPDRYTTDNKPLLLEIANNGYLKSQFETGTSNGGLTAYRNGKRWLWEQRVFDGAYDNAAKSLRPKYGALNFRGYEMGASPRFGSACFQLKPHMLERTTFCYPDSHLEPTEFAVSDRLNALIEKASSTNVDLLDNYIEAHIHGAISLKDDIDYLVLDPIYRFSEIEVYALKLGVPIRWHDGYALSIEQMCRHPNYRGQHYIELAKALGQHGKINAKLLGLAVTEQGYNEQDVKKVWHYLARFGYLSKQVEY